MCTSGPPRRTLYWRFIQYSQVYFLFYVGSVCCIPVLEVAAFLLFSPHHCIQPSTIVLNALLFTLYKLPLNNYSPFKHTLHTGRKAKEFGTAKLVGNLYRGEFDGYGVMTYRDGSVYMGDWKHSLKEGWGMYRGSEGSEYVGAFKQGLRHGWGVLSNANGDEYVGEFFVCWLCFVVLCCVLLCVELGVYCECDCECVDVLLFVG